VKKKYIEKLYNLIDLIEDKEINITIS